VEKSLESTPLPYRTNGDDLTRWIEARARGRGGQARALGLTPKGLEGTLLAGEALGLVEPISHELTAAGRDFALSGAAERRLLLQTALLAFPPYGELLRAVAQAELSETTAEWIERWWGTSGYGSSESNRSEAAAAFGRIAEYAGLGSYVPGRRGHPTRVRWSDALGSSVASTPSAPQPPGEYSPAVSPGLAAGVGNGGRSTVTVTFRGGQEATLTLPAALPPDEKRRLLALIDLLVGLETEGAGR
jgi:hypothetical protein